MTRRTYSFHDATIHVRSETGIPGGPHDIGDLPDWETFEAVCAVLVATGFAVGSDPKIDKDYSALSRFHRRGRWKELEFKAEVHSRGCEFKFFQNVVFENRSGGEYDFGRRAKMPYLTGKRYEAAIGAISRLLEAGGFADDTRLASALPDPLAYFNDQWNFSHDKARGVHRFKRGEDGWPLLSELNAGSNLDSDKTPFWHGDTMLVRDTGGHLRRGRVYGGINGRWIMVYGPGVRDFTHYSHWELFRPGSPKAEGRRVAANGPARLKAVVKKSEAAATALIAAGDYEAAQAALRRLRSIAPHAEKRAA